MATPVLMPKQGNSVESCLIVAWKKQKGDRIEVGDILCEIETDKAVMDLESPAAGILLELLYQEGDDVAVQTSIAIIGEAGEDLASLLKSTPTTEPIIEHKSDYTPTLKQEDTTFVSIPSSAAASGAISPRAKRLAVEKRVAVAQVAGSGPSGRIIERDVLAAIVKQSAISYQPSAHQARALSDNQALPDVASTPLKGTRKRIAERMLESLQTTAQLTLNAFADARDLQECRNGFKADTKFGFQQVTLNDLLHFAVARTLLEHLELNSLFQHDTVYQHQHVHLGFAVDTPRGLLVPVIRDADSLKLKELSSRAKELAIDSQQGRIKPEDLQGGTFTVSNLGSFGIESFTPILNPPQVAILGVGAISLKAIQVDNSVQHIPHMALSLTINHQIIDGAPAAKFLQALSQNIASIRSLLIS
jgi:pyruvate dehydrogenase E2 component (dihydrolipoamide acetyltransferase)